MFECVCDSIPVISNCTIQTQTITKREYSWLGFLQLDNHSYISANNYCPFDYCNMSLLHIKSYAHNLSQDDQCQYNRTGTLCGACPKGWSLVLGSSECREKCSSVWVLLIIPFGFAGILLVIVIHCLNLTVTMGTVCGLIFYANIVQDYSTAFLSSHPIPVLTPILQVFLSWLNLDLGIATCFYNGMEAFGKTILFFLFPIYILVISVTIVILSNRYIKFTRLVGVNALKVLSTLFLLSYSKMCRVTIGVLNFKILSIYVGNSTETTVRWAMDGTIPYFDPQKHLALFLLAMLVFILLLPFTMSLLGIRHLYHISNWSRRLSWVDKLKPFFDTFTGPFKDKARYWAGLLLFIRLLLLILHALDYKDSVIPYYIIVTICLFLAAVMFLLHGVYKKHFLSILEYFFILNICALFLINTYKGSSSSWQCILSHILVSSAFVTFIGIVAYHVHLKWPHLGFMIMRKIQFRQHGNARYDPNMQSFEGMRGYEPILQVDRVDNEEQQNKEMIPTASHPKAHENSN